MLIFLKTVLGKSTVLNDWSRLFNWDLTVRFSHYIAGGAASKWHSRSRMSSHWCACLCDYTCIKQIWETVQKAVRLRLQVKNFSSWCETGIFSFPSFWNPFYYRFQLCYILQSWCWNECIYFQAWDLDFLPLCIWKRNISQVSWLIGLNRDSSRFLGNQLVQVMW